jgi:hypothetical protein
LSSILKKDRIGPRKVVTSHPYEKRTIGMLGQKQNGISKSRPEGRWSKYIKKIYWVSANLFRIEHWLATGTID